MLTELESFAREWEAHERSRHVRLMEDLKREFRVEPKPTAAEKAIDTPDSLRLPPAAVPRKSYHRYPGRSVDRSPRQPE